MTSINKTARIAGALYLIYIIVEVLADKLFRSPLIVTGDAAATAANLAAHALQFRFGIVGDLLAGVLFLMTAWALYVLLKPVNRDLALLFLLLNLGGVAARCANDLNLFAALLLSSGAGALNGFQADQLQALAMAFLDFQINGHWVSQIFFGAWLFPLGYLIFKSGFLPRVLGIVFMVHCVAWLTTAIGFLLFPGFTAITYLSYPLGFIAEFGLSMWLLIMGVKDRAHSERSASTGSSRSARLAG